MKRLAPLALAALLAVAYDSRAHGESGGDACTYGFYEKQDLARVLDHLTRAPHGGGRARAFLRQPEEPRRRGHRGGPTADAWRQVDGWLTRVLVNRQAPVPQPKSFVTNPKY